MVNCISQNYKDIFKRMLDQHVGDAVISAFLSVAPSCEKVAGIITTLAPVRKAAPCIAVQAEEEVFKHPAFDKLLAIALETFGSTEEEGVPDFPRTRESIQIAMERAWDAAKQDSYEEWLMKDKELIEKYARKM